MKRKMIFGVMVVFLFFVQAQTVFGQDYTIRFADKFAANDMAGIETLLREHGHQMDLQICLKTVAFNLVLLNPAYSNSPITTNVGGVTAVPMYRNRNSILRVIQLLVEAGVDINAGFLRGDLFFKADDGEIHMSYNVYRYAYILDVASWDRLNVDIVKYLLSAGADVYKAKFEISDDRIAINRLLIEYGYNVNNPTEYATVDDGVSIPARGYLLTKASKEGQIATVRLLVEAGAMVNRSDYDIAWRTNKTAAQFAYEKKEIDIYNYLKQNGATWTAPSQVASAPPSSSQQPRSTYNDTYDYTPSPSSSGSSSSSTPSRNLGKEIADAFKSPIQSGTYSLAGTQAKIRLTSIARSGIFTYTNRQNRTGTGNYSIDGNRMTIQMEGFTYLYTVTSETSFSGNGETWVRTGY